MQIINYSDRNAFTGLSSVSIFIFIYIINVLLVSILKSYISITKGKFGGLWLYNYLIKGLFFNAVLLMTMEAYLDFVIFGFLNLYTLDVSMDGEILGSFETFFCLIQAVFFLPFTLIWAMFKDKNYISSKEFRKKFKVLYEFINLKNRFSRLYNLIYILRRILFVMMCFNKKQIGSLVLAILIGTN